MIRRLKLLIAAFFTLYCSTALAVGLGDLELNSALNQRFDAEISLSSIGALEENEIIPNLASQADFDRVGVDRNYQLTDLRFRVKVRDNGEFYVHVTSNKPVIEPFLNFIVEVIWPTGRILREYTVLLDPPLFGTDGIEKIDPSQASGPSAGQPAPQTSRQQRRPIPPAPSVASGRTEGVVTQDDEYGITGPGDTLWTIALKVRPSESVSVQQTMLAIQRANPEAFINNNINLLKAGHVLRIPDLSEIRAETTSDAIAEVKVQNEEFEDYKSGEVTQLDARRTARRTEVDDTDADDGELKLLAADQSGARSGADDARMGQLEDSLAVAREDLDRARRANTELNVRLDDLAGQVETLNEIVKLKDDQLAALRAELQRAQAAETTAAVPAASTTTQQPASGSLLTNPMVLGGLAVLLIGGIAAAMILLRKRREAADLEEDDFPEVSLAAADEAEEEEDLDVELADDEDAEEDEEVTQQTSDVIGEAEIYIAYGRFPQAISFLQNAIENEPERADIQLKLLEVYVQTEDATAFNLQYEQLKMLGDDDAAAKAAELQAQIPGAAETSAASMDATIVSSEPIEAIAEPGDDDDDDLSFDLDDLDAETEDDDLDLGSDDDEAEELSLDEAMELGDADLDLDLDAADEALADDEAAEELDMELDLDDDLDLDFDDDSDGLDDTLQLDEDDAVPASDGDSDLDLDLSDDLDLSGDDDDGLADTVQLDDAELDLGDDLSADDDALDLGDDDDGLELDLDDSADADDDGLELDLAADDDALDLGDLEDSADADDDDALDLGDLDTGDDDDALDLGDLDDDDDALDLSAMDDDDDALDLGDLDDGGDLDLDDSLSADGSDDVLELDLDADDDFDLGELEEDEDLGELNLDEDASSKLDLARAYIEMGDTDGAKALLEEVTNEGTEEDIAEANELLGKLD